MAEEREDGKEFASLLLKSMEELTKRIEEMGWKIVKDNKQWEIPREFQIREGSDTSHHPPEPNIAQQLVPRTPPRSTMPTFLASGVGAGGPQEPEVAHYEE